MSKDIDIVEAAKGLFFAAGLAVNVAQADIRSAAASIAQKYGETRSHEIEAEIARHLRRMG